MDLLINRLLKIFYIALFFFTPLMMYPFTSELFEFNKIIFIYLITILVVFLWLLKIILNKKFEVKRSFLDYPIILFYVSQVLSTIFSIDIHTSLFGYYGRFNGGLASISAYILLFYAFISNFNKKDVLKFLKVSLISSVIVILWGLPGKFGFDLSCLLFVKEFNNSCWTDQFHPELRMFSTLGQPNWLGAYLIVNFFIGLFFYFKNLESKNAKYEILNIVYLLLNFAALLFTRSRSSYFAFGVGLLIFIVIGLVNFKESLKKIGLKKIGTLFVIVIVLIVIFKTGIPKVDKFLEFPVSSRLAGNKAALKQENNQTEKLNITESLDIRKIVWKGAINLGLKYPIFGSGVETFAYAYYFTRPAEHNLTSEWDYLYNKAHNEYLNYFATTGFVGLGAYLIMIGTVCFVMLNLLQHLKNKSQILKRVQDDEKNEIINNQLLITCLFLAYLTILITNFFGFSVTTINIFFYLIPAFVITLSNEDNKFLSFDLKIHKKISIFFAILATIYLLLATFLYWFGDLKYAESNKYSQADDYKTASSLLLQALQFRQEHVYQDKLSYNIANLAYYYSNSKDIKQTAELIKLSKDYNARALLTSPKNVLYWKTKAKDSYLYYGATLKPNYIKEGIEALKQVGQLSPTDPRNYYSLAIYYSILYDEASDKKEKESYKNLSIQSLDKMIELKPDYTEGLALQKQLLEKYQK